MLSIGDYVRQRAEPEALDVGEQIERHHLQSPHCDGLAHLQIGQQGFVALGVYAHQGAIVQDGATGLALGRKPS